MIDTFSCTLILLSEGKINFENKTELHFHARI